MKLSLHSLLLFAGLFLFFIRCDITDQDFEKDITIADVQEYYSNLDLDHTNGRSDEISILWEDASYKDVTTGKALVFPIESTTRQYVSLEEQNVLVPINRATHAFAYKDEEDQIHLDYVLELQLEDTDLFTGYTIVGSWGSEPDRVYTYEDGNLIDGQSDGRLELDCVTTDYYECTSVSVGDVIYGNSCTLVRRSITCISTAPSQLAPEDFGTRGGGGGGSGDGTNLCPDPNIADLMVPCEDIPGCGANALPDDNGNCLCKPEYKKDSNGECVPDTDDPDLNPDCHSWDFVPVGPEGNYQACGVNGIHFDYYTSYPEGPNRTRYERAYYQLGTLYFEFPRVRADGSFISAGEAAYIMAQTAAITESRMELYFAGRPVPSGVELELKYLDIFRSIIERRGGRLTLNSNYGIVPVRQFETTLFGYGGCY